ncbi:phosphoribosyl-AMP cyclohydrolase [Alteromonas lipotrueae]|uniref:phosphoribosyl-AMP cyclohydrolase n=1 Tax=Alteromonas lipotrueae TaxID=2803814 RepID=UPI001C44315A|nr:phosphoribosyl-AMP cyclohydrolase [Alteromonas lipotrueae]
MFRKLVAVSILALGLVLNVDAANDITKQDVLNAEKVWGDAIVAIGKSYSSHADYKALAAKTIDTLYAYNEGTVLFKPTRASSNQFRLKKDEAVSYFVTGVVPEDHGFAIQPWNKVRFENTGIIIYFDSATAMGNYYFTDAKTGKETKAEFTFSYIKNADDKMLITVHHSSFPYHPAP